MIIKNSTLKQSSFFVTIMALNQTRLIGMTSISQVYPSQGDDFKQSWLNHAIADLPNMDENNMNSYFP